jgi:hypothetical protein
MGKGTHLDATLFAFLDESHLAPFPERTVLELRLCGIDAVAVLVDSFFIGPAPRLVQKHHLRGIQLLPVRQLLCLPLASSILTFGIFLIASTLQLRRWPLVWPQ